MPLQRLLTLYLAAVAFWIILSWVVSGIVAPRRWLAPVLAAGLPLAILLIQTRSLGGLSPDPASPVIPPVSLYSGGDVGAAGASGSRGGHPGGR